MRIWGKSPFNVLRFHDYKKEHKDYGVHKHPLHGAEIAGTEGVWIRSNRAASAQANAAQNETN